MTFDDLKAALDDVGRRAEEAPTDPVRISHAFLHRSRSALGPIRWTLTWEVSWAVLAVVLLVGFLATHTASPWTVLASAVLLLACEILYLATTIRQLVHLIWIDFAAPMPEVQRRLAALWVLRSRVVRNTLLVAPLVWLPMLIVAVAWITGVDLVAEVSVAWVISNLAFGLVVLGCGLWIAQRRPAWIQSVPWLCRLSDHLAGQSLRRALALADEAVAFNQDQNV